MNTENLKKIMIGGQETVLTGKKADGTKVSITLTPQRWDAHFVQCINPTMLCDLGISVETEKHDDSPPLSIALNGCDDIVSTQ